VSWFGKEELTVESLAFLLRNEGREPRRVSGCLDGLLNCCIMGLAVYLVEGKRRRREGDGGNREGRKDEKWWTGG